VGHQELQEVVALGDAASRNHLHDVVKTVLLLMFSCYVLLSRDLILNQIWDEAYNKKKPAYLAVCYQSRNPTTPRKEYRGSFHKSMCFGI
jgi:hypothetical protein